MLICSQRIFRQSTPYLPLVSTPYSCGDTNGGDDDGDEDGHDLYDPDDDNLDEDDGSEGGSGSEDALHFPPCFQPPGFDAGR